MFTFPVVLTLSSTFEWLRTKKPPGKIKGHYSLQNQRHFNLCCNSLQGVDHTESESFFY